MLAPRRRRREIAGDLAMRATRVPRRARRDAQGVDASSTSRNSPAWPSLMIQWTSGIRNALGSPRCAQ
jgi:hypothetical protein